MQSWKSMSRHLEEVIKPTYAVQLALQTSATKLHWILEVLAIVHCNAHQHLTMPDETFTMCSQAKHVLQLSSRDMSHSSLQQLFVVHSRLQML